MVARSLLRMYCGKDCSAITFLEQLQLHNIMDRINFFYMPVDKAKRPSEAGVGLPFESCH